VAIGVLGVGVVEYFGGALVADAFREVLGGHAASVRGLLLTLLHHDASTLTLFDFEKSSKRIVVMLRMRGDDS